MVVMVLMGLYWFYWNYNGVYWYVIDSIGGMLNPIEKMPKHNNNECFNGFTGKKLMVYNGILMETIGISVMFLLGFYCLF